MTVDQRHAASEDNRIIGLGSGGNPDSRVTETADLHYDGADHQFDLRDPWPFEDDSVDGLVARHALEHIPHRDLGLVFEEAARVLSDDGWFEVRVPVGSDLATDATHRSGWAWRTIDGYLDEDCHWVPTPQFELKSKTLDAWMCGPMWPLTPLVKLGARKVPCEFWYEFPGATGELTIRLEVDV